MKLTNKQARTAAITFGTKAETLERVANHLKRARVLPQVRADARRAVTAPEALISQVESQGWLDQPLIVRSSAASEDKEGCSLAGRFLSVPGVIGKEALRDAILRVAGSIAQEVSGQIFIQPYLSVVAASGVVFSRDPNTGGHYVVINYDDTSGRTDSVTAGRSNSLKTFYYYRGAKVFLPPTIRSVVAMVDELEQLFETDRLDIEFAIDASGELYLLQVRPLYVAVEDYVPEARQRSVLEEVTLKIEQCNRPHPYLHGVQTVYGVMPDWNPAEIIGIRPRPLALSLYKDIITDATWAYQRDNYGYKNLRSFPLLVSFGGLPYIDVRVSFNSFIPAEVDSDLSEKLVNYYVRRLLEVPSYHDKVEFQVVYSCYTLDLPSRLSALEEHGFTEIDRAKLMVHLRNLTNRIINGETGLWRKDLVKIEKLAGRRLRVRDADMDLVSKIYWLLEDCKRYGTLPFAGLARAAFIAVQMLQSMVAVRIFSREDYDRFLGSLSTVSSQMNRDFSTLSRAEFLAKYGHLRPGTYDILSPRYDEEPSRYFDWSKREANLVHAPATFALTLEQLKQTEKMLKSHDLQHNVLGLFEFFKAAIEGREYAKFIFTQNLSDALSLLKRLGEENGFSPEDCSYLDIGVIKTLYSASGNTRDVMAASIAAGRERYSVTRKLLLPPLITGSQQVWAFELAGAEPNFVTMRTASGPVAHVSDALSRLKGSILFISSADPGYDWIFAHEIAGFVTMYGGVNSHMAIRAAELGIPAVIGAGERAYLEWEKFEELEIDCANRQVRGLR